MNKRKFQPLIDRARAVEKDNPEAYRRFRKAFCKQTWSTMTREPLGSKYMPSGENCRTIQRYLGLTPLELVHPLNDIEAEKVSA
jgi:hypothetical protein